MVFEGLHADFQKTDMWFLYFAQVLSLVILYVWCAACDPADPGVHHLRRAAESKKLAAKAKAAKESGSSDTGLDQSQYDSDRSLSLTFPLKNEDASGGSIFSSMGGCLCSLVHKKLQDSEMFYSGEQLLYCSICDAEVSSSLVLFTCSIVVALL